MKHLTQDELQSLKKKLETKKEELETQLTRLGSRDPVTKEWEAKYKDIGEDWDDNAHEVQNFSDATTLEASLSEHVAQVSAALQRMEQGTYGICSVGGEEIEIERLILSPETDLCTKHAGK